MEVKQQTWNWTTPKERIVWPENVYPALCVDVLIDNFEGKYGKLSTLVFEISDPINNKQTRINFAAYPKITKDSRMGKAVMALGIPVGANFSPSDLKGRQCRVLIKTKTFQDKTGAKVTESYIADILAKGGAQ